MPNDDNEVKDVDWREVNIEDNDNSLGQIKFKKNRNRSRLKSALRFVLMVVVASISGAVTAAYIVNVKYSDSLVKSNTPIFQKKKALSSNNINSDTSVAENSINKVAQEVGPSVVGVTNDPNGFKGKGEDAAGSGVIIRSDGYIVTNYHIVQDANTITVKLPNGKNGNVFKATLVGFDDLSDLAIIKINSRNLPAAVFGDSSKIKIGDNAVAIGNPLGEEFQGSVTLGIISAINKSINMSDDTTGEISKYKIIETDAVINQGNSGGALCNENGEIIGINSLKLGTKYTDSGISVAISINEAKKIIDQIIKNGKVTRPFLGVVGGTALADKNNGIQGAYIKTVVSGSGLAKAGIKPGDIIVELDGVKVTSIDDIRDIIQDKKIGDKLPCKVYRKGKYIKCEVALSENKE
ncbi:S1C family serine protease [Clostridium neuense]|uniref:S1C family serine protease n=1 Tax=Clostridium neuense TaxID=1728934 RepID=A0ABW8TKW1_9CLOT